MEDLGIPVGCERMPSVVSAIPTRILAVYIYGYIYPTQIKARWLAYGVLSWSSSAIINNQRVSGVGKPEFDQWYSPRGERDQRVSTRSSPTTRQSAGNPRLAKGRERVSNLGMQREPGKTTWKQRQPKEASQPHPGMIATKSARADWPTKQ